MAKKKRLNKRMLVLLVSVVVVVLLVAGYALLNLNTTDVSKEQKNFDTYMANGNYEEAVKAQSKLRTAAKDHPDELAKCEYKLAQAYLAWSKVPQASDHDKADREGKAASSLKAALRSNKGYVEAEKLLVDIYWGHMGPEDFIQEATNLIAMAPDDAEAYFRRAQEHASLAMRLHNAEHSNQAVTDFRKATSLKKDVAEYWIRYAMFAGMDVAKLSDNCPLPDKVYSDAMAANPDNAEIMVDFADWQLRHDNRAEAMLLIDKAIKNAPHDARGYIARAQLRHMEQKVPEAIADLEKAIEVDPTDVDAYADLSSLYCPPAPPQLAKAAQCLRDGIDNLNKHATSQPASKQNPENLTNARFRLDILLTDVLLSMINRKEGDREKLRAEVQSLLDQVSELRLQSPFRKRLAGRLALSDVLTSSTSQPGSARLDDAIRLLTEADTGFNHADKLTAGDLVQAYGLSGKPVMIAKTIDGFLATPGNEHDPDFLMIRARLLMSTRDYPKAIATLDAVLKFYPDYTEAKNMRETAIALNGTSTTGDISMSKEVSITESNVRFFLDQAQTAWALDNHAGAIKLLEELHRKLPDNQDVSRALVNGYIVNKQDADAKNLLDKLIADCKEPKTKQNLQDIREQLNTPDLKQRQAMAYKKTMELADAQEGELKKALSKASVALQYGVEDDYVKYLDQAAKADPKDKVVISREFELALSRRKIADAQKWADAAVQNNTDGLNGKEFQARLAAVRNDLPGAIALLEQCYKEQPDSAKIQLMLADFYRASGATDKAESLYKTLFDNNPGNPDVLKGLVLVSQSPDKRDQYVQYVQAGFRLAPTDPFFTERNQEIKEATVNPEESIPVREKMLARNPKDLASIYRLAALYEYTNQPSKAEEMCVRALQVAEDKIGAARNLGQFYLRNKRFGDVRKMMDELLRQKLDPVPLHGLYGEFLMTQDMEQARREFQKAIDASPQDPRGYFYMARFDENRQLWADAVTNMITVMDLDKTANGQAAEKELVKDQLNAGQSDPRQLDNAAARINTLLTHRPGDIETLYLKAMWALVKDPPSPKDAEEALTTAITLNKDDRTPLLNRANFYVGQGELGKARTDLEAAQKLAPSELDISLELAKVMVLQYQVDKAVLQLKEILQRNPDYGPAINELVGVYLRKHMWEELDTLLTPILKKNKNPAPLYVIKYQELLAQGKNKEALDALEKARSLAPESQDILRTYLQAMMDQKMYSDAITKIDKLQAEKPKDYDWLDALKVRALVGAGHKAEADKIFESKYATYQSPLFDLLMEQAIAAYTPKEVVDRLVRWSSARPNDLKAMYYLGNIAIEAEEFDVADKNFDQAIDLAKSPQEKLQYERLKAASYYQRHVAHRPETDYRDRAEKLFTEVIQKSKNMDVQALNNLAYLYVDDMNDPDKALVLAQRAAKIQPSSSVLDTYGWVLGHKAARESDRQAKNDLFDQARQHLERSVELQAGIENRYHLGWVYEQMGRTQDGLKYYQQVWELVRDKKQHPLYESVKKAIDRLNH
jgi:lipopolysaccharide biosynthesis regulator YciM